MRMKITKQFVHTLIIMKILVLSCSLHIGKFVLFCNLFEPCNVCKMCTVEWKVVTGAYFKGHSYFARVSDFQLHRNFLMAVSSAQKYKPLQSPHNNAIIETTTPT